MEEGCRVEKTLGGRWAVVRYSDHGPYNHEHRRSGGQGGWGREELSYHAMKAEALRALASIKAGG